MILLVALVFTVQAVEVQRNNKRQQRTTIGCPLRIEMMVLQAIQAAQRVRITTRDNKIRLKINSF